MKRAMTFRPAVFSCTFSSMNRHQAFHAPTKWPRSIRFMIFLQTASIRVFSSTYVHHAFQAPTNCARSIRFKTLAHTTLSFFVSSAHSVQASKDSARWRFSNRCINRRTFLVCSTSSTQLPNERDSSPFNMRAITRFAAVLCWTVSSTNVHQAFQAPNTWACSIRFRIFAHVAAILRVSPAHSAHATNDIARCRFINRCSSCRTCLIC